RLKRASCSALGRSGRGTSMDSPTGTPTSASAVTRSSVIASFSATIAPNDHAATNVGGPTRSRIVSTAARTSSTSASPPPNDPSEPITPRKLNVSTANPRRASSLRMAHRIGWSLLPPPSGWGWQITADARGEPSGIRISASSESPSEVLHTTRSMPRATMADHMGEAQRTGVAIREPLAWHDLVQVVQTAEQTGYEALFVPEGLGREAFATPAGLAPVTERILLAPGVAAVTARPARTAAMAAATVQELSGGRFILGIGAGFERRIDAIRAYLNEVRQTQLSFDAGPTPAVWLAALGDRMIALAGEIADGVLLNWCTP